MNDDHLKDYTPLVLDLNSVFTLGQLILASHVPKSMMCKVQVNGNIGQLMEYHGTWPISLQGTDRMQVTNHAHFVPYVRMGPGMWSLSKTEMISVPITKEELMTLYRFYHPQSS